MCTRFQRCAGTYRQSSLLRSEEHACHYKVCHYILEQIRVSLELCNLHNLKFDSKAFLLKGAWFKLSRSISRGTS